MRIPFVVATQCRGPLFGGNPLVSGIRDFQTRARLLMIPIIIIVAIVGFVVRLPAICMETVLMAIVRFLMPVKRTVHFE